MSLSIEKKEAERAATKNDTDFAKHECLQMSDAPDYTGDDRAIREFMHKIVTENPYEFRVASWTDMPLNCDPFRRYRELVQSYVLLKRPDATADEIALVQRLAISRSNPFEPAYMRELPEEQMWAAELVDGLAEVI